jgi:hypothetical protein
VYFRHTPFCLLKTKFFVSAGECSINLLSGTLLFFNDAFTVTQPLLLLKTKLTEEMLPAAEVQTSRTSEMRTTAAVFLNEILFQ